MFNILQLDENLVALLNERVEANVHSPATDTRPVLLKLDDLTARPLAEHTPITERDEPIRIKLLNEKDEPNTPKEVIDKLDPNRILFLKDTEEPSTKVSKTEQRNPTLKLPRTDTVLPSST